MSAGQRRTADGADGPAPRRRLGAALLYWTVVPALATALSAALLLTLLSGGIGISDDVEVHTQVGNSSDRPPYAVWARNDDGTAVRFDPCTPIDIVIADGGAPTGWRSDLDRAVTTIREASGLPLRVTREVDEEPSADRAPFQPRRYGQRWAPILLAWSTPDTSDPLLRDFDRGIAIPVAVGPDGDRTFVTGQVVLNAARDDLRPGGDDRATSWRATLLHELLHVLGLAHVDDPAQLMSTHPEQGPILLGDGDRAGLTEVGARAGCRDLPEPRAVEVDRPRELDHS